MTTRQHRSHHAKKGITLMQNSSTASKPSEPKTPLSAPTSTLPYPELEDVKLDSAVIPMKAAPVQKKGTSGSATSASGRTDKYKKLNELIVAQVGGMGLGMMQVPFLRKDGVVLFGHCQKLAENMTDCARINEGLFKVLMSVFSGAVYTALILQTVAITGSILSNHNIQIPLPAGLKKALAGSATESEETPYSFQEAMMDAIRLAALLSNPQPHLDVNALIMAANQMPAGA